MKSNDLTDLLRFLVKTNTQYKAYTDPQYIDDESVNEGCVLSICVRSAVNFNFNKNGRLLGTSTDSAKSYQQSVNRS